MTELHALSEMNEKERKENKNLLKYKIWVDPARKCFFFWLNPHPPKVFLVMRLPKGVVTILSLDFSVKPLILIILVPGDYSRRYGYLLSIGTKKVPNEKFFIWHHNILVMSESRKTGLKDFCWKCADFKLLLISYKYAILVQSVTIYKGKSPLQHTQEVSSAFWD